MTGEQALYGRNKWLICLYMYYYLTKCRKSNEWLEHVPKSPELLNQDTDQFITQPYTIKLCWLSKCRQEIMTLCSVQGIGGNESPFIGPPLSHSFDLRY